MVLLDSYTGTKILGDRYYLHNLIAQSNHSKVFLATDLAIDYRKCVIKQLYPTYCPVEARAKAESTFLQEAKILKQVARKQTQICQFYNYFIDSGHQYIVQEWVEGTTLEEILCQRSRLSESETKDIVLKLLLVLESVHSLGIVHNDIKPGNIILRSPDGSPVLIDFGIAKEVNTEFGQNIVGTPGYMSLEQAMGKASFNNDLYSLGLTAIHLLTGKSPLAVDFDSDTNNFWHQEKTAFDPKLVTAIDRAISSQDRHKFNSAREMRQMWQPSRAISFPTPISRDRAESTLENSLLISILAVLGVWFCLSCLLMLQLNSKPKSPEKSTHYRKTEGFISPLSDRQLR